VRSEKESATLANRRHLADDGLLELL